MEPEASSTSVLNTMEPVKLLVLGGGYCGRRLAQRAAASGIGGCISQRDPQAAAAPPPGWTVVGFDSATDLRPSPAELAGVTHVLSTIAPLSDGRDPVLVRLSELLQQLQPRWLGYLSTTGVYGDTGGAWVDETSACRPSSKRSQARLACERSWQALALPLQIFRLPAIYGPGRNVLLDLQRGRSRLLHKPGQVFCRVHVDDICGAVLHCLQQPAAQQPGVVNVCDAEPCSSSEQLGFAAHLLGCPLPPLQRFAAVCDQMSPMALSFWQENRRVRNDLLCRQLGYRLLYPSYREGLRACLAAAGGQALVAGAGSAT
ncbi:MAG: SDR family oxidoreductase [Cyanobacteriota bacterium]|nr:SDR family oxidoreductase [Cyanobacteriota bacterium]